MESENQSTVLNDLLVTHTMGNHLHDTTKWCRFLAIVGIVFLLIFLIIAIIAGNSIAPIMSSAFPGAGEIVGSMVLVIVILFIAVFGILAFFLLRFASYTRRGLELRNQTLFNEGLKALKIYFILYGVIGILGVCINAFSLFAIFNT